MKKFITLGNIVKCCGIILALVTFFFIFANQLHINEVTGIFDVDEELLDSESIVKATLAASLAFGGGAVDGIGALSGNGLAIAGYILILVGALGAIALIFVPLKHDVKKFVVLGLGLLILVGAILLFVEALAFANTNGDVLEALGSETTVEYEGETCTQLVEYTVSLDEGVATLGALSVAGGIAVACSEFISDRPLIK